MVICRFIHSQLLATGGISSSFAVEELRLSRAAELGRYLGKQTGDESNVYLP